MTCSGEPRLIPSCEAAIGDDIRGAGVLGHVQRVLVAHVDHGGADLDPTRSARPSRPGAGTATRAAGRSGGRGRTRHPRRAPRPRPPARSIGGAHRRPSAPASRATPTNGRTTGTRSSSHADGTGVAVPVPRTTDAPVTMRDMHLRFLGGATTVTGSQFLLTTEQAHRSSSTAGCSRARPTSRSATASRSPSTPQRWTPSS